jgi:hypothetical protein
MDLENDVVIVSAYGRGQWMAAELARHGHKVTLVDVSDSLGRWAPEDWEGPFGFFRSDRLSPTQVERLLEDDTPDSSSSGFTIWLKGGPLEFKGPLTHYRLNGLCVAPLVREYLVGFSDINRAKSKERKSEIETMPYQEVWLASFAHQLSSSRYLTNREGIKSGAPLPLFSPHLIRHATRPGYQRSLTWVEQLGARVVPKAEILDVGFNSPSLMGSVEVTSPAHQGIIKGDSFVWMLSTLETHSISERLFSKIYSGTPNQPQWFWQRTRINIEPSLQRESLPQHFVLVETVEFPWTHENMAIVQRTSSRDNFDLWMRVPYLHRFQKSYLEVVIKKLINLLEQRLPENVITILEQPREFSFSPNDLGVARFPVYDSQIGIPKTRAKNLTVDGPEAWPGLDWVSQMEVHHRITNKLEKQRQEKLRKEAEH